MAHKSILVAALALVVVLTGLLIADLAIYGVHVLDIVTVPILLFLWIVVVGSLVRPQ